MSGSAAKKRNQRLALWRRQGGRCWWCGCQTHLPPVGPGSHRKSIPDDEATIDHLDSRLSSARGTWHGCYRRVMACRACNYRRGAEEQRWLAHKKPQELWERTGAIVSIAKMAGCLNELEAR